MKKVMKKFNRALSIMLVAAMVLTMAPQTAMPVLAASDDAVESITDTPDETVESGTDVGETDEALADEENEEVTEPSDEGNSDTEGDDILDEDPADEDLATEEPSEGDVEEVEEPTIGLMDGEETDTFSVTLPANQQGYTITEAAATATKGTNYTFKVTANDTWKIIAVTYTIGEQESELEAGENNIYTIKGKDITGDISINVEAVQTFKVTVNAPDTVTLQYAVGTGSPQPMTAGTPVTVERNAEVKLTVTPNDATYDVTVKKGNTVIKVEEDNANVYDLGKITADATYAVTAAKNRVTITEKINPITVDEKDEDGKITSSTQVNSAKIVYSGTDYTPETESAPQMITKKKALKFTLEYADALKDKEDLKVVVSYKVGATGKETTLKADNAGAYTIAANLVTDDIALDVYVDEYKTFAVAMQPDENVEKIMYAIGTGTMEELSAGEDGKYALDVTEDSVLKFQLTAKKYYKIKEVKAGGEPVKADSKSVYTLTVTQAETITVATELDPAQQGSLTFKVTGDAKSASATFIDPIGGAQTTVEAGETVKLAAVKDVELTLTIAPKAGYTITNVTGATAVAATQDADANAKQYTVKFPANKTATVTVTTDATASTKESKVSFVEDDSVSHMSYNVKNGGTTNVTKDEDGNYTVAEGAKKLEFSITVTGSYKPTVNMTGKDVQKPEEGDEEGGQDGKAREADETPIEIKYAKVTTTKTGATYDYVIPATQLKDDNTLTILETPDERIITLDVSESQNVDIVASVDGTKISAESDGSYKVLLNTVVAFQITAQENTSLTKVVSKIDGKETNAKITNNTAAVEVKVTGNTQIEIVAKDQYVASKLMENGKPLTVADEKKNSYNVAYNGTYTATVTKANVASTLSDVKVLVGNNSVTDAADDKKVASFTGNTATINLSNAADVTAIAGKTLTVELYASETTGDVTNSVKAATYSLNVSVPATGIQIDKKDNLEATQAIDTTKTYTVTAAKGVDLNKLVVADIQDSKGIIATTTDDSNDGDEENQGQEKATTKRITYANGKLTVTMAAKKPDAEATATITIKEDGAADGASAATLTITAAELINGNTAAPTVKMVAATDAAFKLTLSAKTAQTASGNLYYKVVSKEKVENAVAKETYVQKTGDSQTALVKVSDTSKVATYEVTASLVHLDKEVTNNTLGDATVLGASSKESKTQTLKTQTPAYEDKLKLKKGKTTIVTGEKDIVIAEPQYNKYTTFLSLPETGAVEDITPNLTTDEKLTVAVIPGLDEKITATATDKTKIGKHKIQVTASAENNAYASVATIDVTVVRGIHKLNVTVPSTNLYKANKKPAKVKATVVYNEDMTSPAPKSKNVTWEIVGSDYIKKMVTVKNGTVTVDKNFIVDTDVTKNQFKIKVTTANSEKTFVGGTYDENGKLNPIVGESETITITGQGEDINTLAIVQAEWDGSANDYKGYVVKALPTGTKEATKVFAKDLKNAKVVAFTSNADKSKTQYTPAELAAATIDLDLLTLKSSNQKSLPVWDGGWITVNKVGKVKLTATAKDGSNKKAELSLEIRNDETEGTLGLRMYEAEYDKNGQPQAKTVENNWIQFFNPDNVTDTNISHDFSETPVVLLQVQQKGENDANYKWVPDFANFSLTVQGGKIVKQEEGTKAYVAINAKTVTVKLTDKSKKSDNVVTYVLTNTGADAKPTFKAKNKLHSKGTADEQTTDIEISKLTNVAEGTDNLVAKIAVDWSAKNTKNEKDLTYLAGILKDEYPLDSVKQNASKFELSFNSSSEINLNQKSYKLTVTLYGKSEVAATDGDGGSNTNEFSYTPVTAPTSMTVSVDSAKKFTYKPTTSYTLKTKDVKASAELTGKASVTDGCTVVWSDLQNLNTKGKTNKFATYFTIDTTDSEKPLIKLAKLTDKGNFPDKADCTGYITYTATADKNYYSDKKVTGTVKITVKFDEKKPLATYSQDKPNNQLPTIYMTTGSTADIGITAKVGKGTAELVKLSYVTVDTEDKTSSDFTAAKGASDGALKLTYGGNGLKKNTTYKVKLYIVPEGSYYKEIIDQELSTSSQEEESETPAEKEAELTALYGIPVTVQVKAIEAPIAEKTYTVTITSGPDTVTQNSSTATYEAEVKEDGVKLDDATVTWKVEAKDDATLNGTSINENGVLTVGSEQAANSVLLITATYTPEGGSSVKSEAKEVTVNTN